MMMRQIIVLSGVLGGGCLLACSSGVGSPFFLGDPYESRAGDYNPPSEDNQDPSPAQTGSRSRGLTPGGDSEGSSGNTSTPSSSGNTSGSSSGSSGATTPPTTGCPPCNGFYKCTITLTNGTSSTTTLNLKSEDGVCTAQGSSFVLACGGQVTSSGQSVGTWASCAKSSTSNVDGGSSGGDG